MYINFTSILCTYAYTKSINILRRRSFFVRKFLLYYNEIKAHIILAFFLTNIFLYIKLIKLLCP